MSRRKQLENKGVRQVRREQAAAPGKGRRASVELYVACWGKQPHSSRPGPPSTARADWESQCLGPAPETRPCLPAAQASTHRRANAATHQAADARRGHEGVTHRPLSGLPKSSFHKAVQNGLSDRNTEGSREPGDVRAPTQEDSLRGFSPGLPASTLALAAVCPSLGAPGVHERAHHHLPKGYDS